jgi:DNA-binding SARP family transcriptional activator
MAVADGNAHEARLPAGDRTIELILLGGFALTSGAEPVSLPPSAQRVLAFLALAERPLARAYVSGSLWPDRSEARAAASLRTAVWRLQQAGPHLINADAQRLGIAHRLRVDYRERSAIAAGVLAGDAGGPGVLAALCRPGELLPDWYEDWIELERERFRLMRASALERLAESLADRRRFAEAAEAGLAAVTSDPLRETAHRALIRVFLAEGNAFEAVRQFRLCRSLTLRHLGAEPSEETVRLVRHLAPGIPS